RGKEKNMSIQIKDLIKKLEEKDQDAMVEFIVVETDGMMVCMDVESSAESMVDLLGLFSNGSK
ncbi:MAG: hypothetical protein KAR42_17960, partial [candidate division Zixibacteria bacterium]|nr:hypothetical protein [candidate division Zixibacteria bacterium]